MGSDEAVFREDFQVTSSAQAPNHPNWVSEYLSVFFMRITGGKVGGRILKVPKGLDVRPTPDLVKQAIFNSLGERVVGARALELFAGSGALSLECLSRGAATVVCVEKSQRHAAFIRNNFAAAGFDA